MASSEQMNSYQTSVFPLPHYFILQLAALASFGSFFHHPGHVSLSVFQKIIHKVPFFFREFSTSFAEGLGPALTLDAVRPDNGLLMSLFAGMVDLEATKQVWDKSNSRLVKLTYAIRGDRAVRFERTDNGFEFFINGQPIDSGLIALAETFYGISFIDAVATVAPLVGLNFSRLFPLSRKKAGLP